MWNANYLLWRGLIKKDWQNVKNIIELNKAEDEVAAAKDNAYDDILF